MQVVIVHYHLHPGGVTGIIEAQIAVLQKYHPETEITLAVGDASGRSYPGVALREIPELNYLPPDADIDTCFEAIDGFFRGLPPSTVVHIHNLNLGKNPVLTMAAYLAGKRGTGILNHNHDFAEDREIDFHRLEQVITRHFAYRLQAVMYPPWINCRFATINRADMERLRHNGISADRIYYLPNPVRTPELEPNRQAAAKLRHELGVGDQQKLLVYPVRPIRRKNLGEFIFLVALHHDRAVGAVTLAPLNPAEKPAYQAWREFTEANALPIRYEIGAAAGLATVMTAADLCVSTSTLEGFGMTFTEPWLYGKPTAGRKIAAVIDDFTAIGLAFPQLYERIDLPEESKDFAELSDREQAGWILRIRQDRKIRDAVTGLNPKLKSLLDPVPEALIAANAAIIKDNFSPANYGRKLYEIYQSIIDHFTAP